MRQCFGLGFRVAFSANGRLVTVVAAMLAAIVTSTLVIAWTLPSAFQAAADRQNDRYPAGVQDAPMRSGHGLILAGAQRDTVIRGHHVAVIEVVGRPDAVPPPGVTALPIAGSSAVSPALNDLLGHVPHALTRARIPHPERLIGSAGLATPDEYFAYVGVSRPPPTRDPARVDIAGWGLRDTQLFTPQLSSYVVLPLLVMVLLPLGSLAGMLLLLDGQRRRRRDSLLHVVGASRSHQVTVDLATVLPGIVAGWLLACALQRLSAWAVATWVMGDRVAFPSDLRAPPTVWLLIGLVIVAVIAGSSFVRHDREVVAARLAGVIKYRFRLRLLMGTALLGVGTMLVFMIASSGSASSLRTYGYIVPAAALVLLGAVVALPPLIIAAARLLAPRTLAGDLARSRLMASRATWRSTALVLMFLGVTAGVGLSVLTVLDASEQTDTVIWNPAGLPAGFGVVAAPTSAAIAIAHADPTHAYPVARVAAGSILTDGATTRSAVPTVLVPCPALRLFLDTGHTDKPCTHAWTLDSTLQFTTRARVRVDEPTSGPTGEAIGEVTLTGVRHARPRSPVEVFDGTEPLIVPAATATVLAMLPRSPTDATKLIDTNLTGAHIDQLRNTLWHTTAPGFSGSNGALSNVVTAGDLANDSHAFQDTYSQLVVGGLTVASLAALLAIALASLLQVAESAERDAVLIAMGSPVSVITRSLAICSLAPAAAAVTTGAAIGLLLAASYLALSSYPQLSGVLEGFPLMPFLGFCAAELTLVLIVFVLSTLVARNALRRVNAGELSVGN